MPTYTCTISAPNTSPVLRTSRFTSSESSTDSRVLDRKRLLYSNSVYQNRDQTERAPLCWPSRNNDSPRTVLHDTAPADRYPKTSYQTEYLAVRARRTQQAYHWDWSSRTRYLQRQRHQLDLTNILPRWRWASINPWHRYRRAIRKNDNRIRVFFAHRIN